MSFRNRTLKIGDERKMPKFLVLWKGVNARVPEKPEDRMKQDTMLTKMVQDDLKSGKLKDFGIFAEGGGGYVIFEGNEAELALETSKYYPFADFEAHVVLTADQNMDVLKKLAQMAPR
jgi:hypothetical protein